MEWPIDGFNCANQSVHENIATNSRSTVMMIGRRGVYKRVERVVACHMIRNKTTLDIGKKMR